jgi:hypothetical protein
MSREGRKESEAETDFSTHRLRSKSSESLSSFTLTDGENKFVSARVGSAFLSRGTISIVEWLV